eukprot:75204_1
MFATLLISLIILVANDAKKHKHSGGSRGSGSGSGTGCADTGTCKFRFATCPASGVLTCDNNKYCQLSCDGDFGCQGRTVQAPEGAELDVYCFGPNSCKDVTIKCPQGAGKTCKLWVTCNPKSNVGSSLNNPCAEGNACPGLSIQYNTATTNYCNCVGDCLNDGGNGNRNDRCPNPSGASVIRFDGHSFNIDEAEGRNNAYSNGTKWIIGVIAALVCVIIVVAICVVCGRRRQKLQQVEEIKDASDDEEEIEVECDVSITKEEGMAITTTSV